MITTLRLPLWQCLNRSQCPSISFSNRKSEVTILLRKSPLKNSTWPLPTSNVWGAAHRMRLKKRKKWGSTHSPCQIFPNRNPRLVWRSRFLQLSPCLSNCPLSKEERKRDRSSLNKLKEKSNRRLKWPSLRRENSTPRSSAMPELPLWEVTLMERLPLQPLCLL